MSGLRTIAEDAQKVTKLLELAQKATGLGGVPAADVLALLDAALGAALTGSSDDVAAQIAALEAELAADIAANDKAVDADIDAKFTTG